MIFKKYKERLIHAMTNDSRGAFRLKRILYSGISTIGAKGINAIITLISVPLMFNFLGEERYGMMMTILSIVTMLHFADLGLGFGLQNRIPLYQEQGDKTLLKKAISSTFFLLLIFAIFLSVIFLGLNYFISWPAALNVDSELAQSEATQSIYIFAFCFLISLPFSIIQKIQNGFQETYFNEIWRTVAQLTGLGLLVYFVSAKKGVPYFIIAIYGANTVGLILNFSHKLFVQRKDLIPSIKFFDFDLFKDLFNDGYKFLIIQIMSVLTISLDSVIIVRYIGPEAVASYNLGYRLIMFCMIPSIAFISPMLFAFNDALAKNDKSWVVRTSRKGLKASLLFSVSFALIILLGANPILNLWIGPEAILSATLIYSFAAFVFFYNFNAFFSTIMLSDRFMLFCFKWYPFAAIIAFLLKLFLVNQIGVSGVLWGSILALTLFFILPSFLFLRKKEYI